MKLISIGKYVNTHGIKGEIKLLSNFSRKDLVFIPKMKIYIKDKSYIIKSYRKHKMFDMLTLEGITDINEIEYLKSNAVFINEEDLFVDYLVEDFIDYKAVFNDITYDIKEKKENLK